MKARVNKNVKIDWMVMGIADDKNNPESLADYVTEGFTKHGFGGEVMVVGTVKNGNSITSLINTFCKMMIKGEEFRTDCTHCIDFPDGKPEYKFNIFKYQPLNGNVKYQLVPYFPESLIVKSIG